MPFYFFLEDYRLILLSQICQIHQRNEVQYIMRTYCGCNAPGDLKYFVFTIIFIKYVHQVCTSTQHYTTPHYTTLHYTTLHYTTLHYTTLHYTTLHYYFFHIVYELVEIQKCVNGKRNEQGIQNSTLLRFIQNKHESRGIVFIDTLLSFYLIKTNFDSKCKCYGNIYSLILEKCCF